MKISSGEQEQNVEQMVKSSGRNRGKSTGKGNQNVELMVVRTRNPEMVLRKPRGCDLVLSCLGMA